jgi:transposase
LLTPRDRPTGLAGGVRGGVKPRLLYGTTQGGGEVVRADARVGRDDRVEVAGVEAVEPHEGVEVHGAAMLELGDLRVAQAQLDRVSLGQGGDRAAGGDHGVTDVVGLYLAPPENAVVLCVDEKSQIQALDRTAPMLPMQPNMPERRTHDYRRHGTTTLFAALEIATGRVTGHCLPRHRHQEFLRFLRQIARAYPGVELHLVMDNYAAHKHPAVRTWLAANPRVRVHFTPTSASWLNLVECWFSIIERQAIHRGSYASVTDLNHRIRAYIDGWNQRAHPFTWTKTAEQILAKANRQKTSDAAH